MIVYDSQLVSLLPFFLSAVSTGDYLKERKDFPSASGELAL